MEYFKNLYEDCIKIILQRLVIRYTILFYHLFFLKAIPTTKYHFAYNKNDIL